LSVQRVYDIEKIQISNSIYYEFVNNCAILKGTTPSSTSGIKQQRSTSKYVGVRKRGGSYVVGFTKAHKTYGGGSYQDEKLAAWAANQLAKQIYGEKCLKRNNVEVTGYVFKDNRAVLAALEPSLKKQKS
jgi:hypothetical protein